jgi:hypothetical protein
MLYYGVALQKQMNVRSQKHRPAASVQAVGIKNPQLAVPLKHMPLTKKTNGGEFLHSFLAAALRGNLYLTGTV